jgi:LPS O-antigen subunit length determinant protein (WzzB/FepE family)
MGVDIRLYSVIYDAIEEVTDAMEGMLSPEIKEEVTAQVEVRQVYHISKVGVVAGAYVIEGKVNRTNKARVDVEYYTKLEAEALKSYEEARMKYIRYADSNIDPVLESYRAKRNDLENDMQLKYNKYTTLNTQLDGARAKVQERTPAFTLLKGASVPVKPAGPKRMLFVLGMLIMVTFGGIVYIIKDDIKEALFQSE